MPGIDCDCACDLVAVPVDATQQCQVVLTALIPVATDVGLGELERCVEHVQPVVEGQYRSIGGCDILDDYLSGSDGEHALPRIGRDDALGRSLGQAPCIVSHKLRIVDHGALADGTCALGIGPGLRMSPIIWE